MARAEGATPGELLAEMIRTYADVCGAPCEASARPPDRAPPRGGEARDRAEAMDRAPPRDGSEPRDLTGTEARPAAGRDIRHFSSVGALLDTGQNV